VAFMIGAALILAAMLISSATMPVNAAHPGDK